MRKEFFPVLLAAALVGSACQRPPEAQSPPPAPGASRPAEAQKPASSLEKKTESGWPVFSSTRFPYLMGYPSSWKLNLEGLDLFRKEGGSNVFWTIVRVDASVLVQPKTTADDFLVQVINSYRNERAGYNINNRAKTKIGGQDAWLISGITRQFGSNPVYFETVLFAKDGRGWLIDLLADPALMQEESQIFRKMRDSFKLR